jgi:two-component system NtrC family sensor kinase
MRALRQIREVPSRVEGSPESLLSQFSASTLELNPSLGLRELCHRSTLRAMELLGARACALALVQSSQWQIAALSGAAGRWEDSIQRALAWRCAEQASAPIGGLRFGSAEKILGFELTEALGWSDLLIAPVTGRGEKILGILCLADVGRSLSTIESRLLEAFTSHASVAIENVRMIERIEQSRRRWVEDFDAISDLIVVHSASNQVLRLNRALAERLGLHPIDAVGLEMADLKILSLPSPPGHCPFCENSSSPKKESTHQLGHNTYLISTSRINSEDGEPRTIHVLKDITDRREAERRFRRERDFNKNILNSTQSMILVLDTAGLISYVNRRCLEVGYQDHELLGHNLAEFVASTRRAAFLESLQTVLGGTSSELEVPLARGMNTIGRFSVKLSPMRDEHGAINSVVVAMADITDAADLQSKLVHTEKMAALGKLVSGVAHEVNNPLAAIVGFTDLLLENPEIPAQAKEELQVILQEAQRTRVIVQNLLSFARQMPAQHAPVQVNSILRQTVQLRNYDFSSRRIELIECYDEDLPLVIADSHQLQQVFLNILNNAYDAVQETGYPGRIEIVTSSDSGHVEIIFRDNGSGISDLDRIFDPFFTTKEVGKGTGLGLSICYGIVRAHQGEIAARNNTNDRGCTFTVRFPAVSEAVELVTSKMTGSL